MVDTFANRLQKAIDIRGVKKAELARRTGISIQRIGQYVRGRYAARQSAVSVIADALNVDPAWLLGFDVPMEPPVDKRTQKGKQKMADDDLKLALFGSAEVSDELLEDIKKMAKIHFELQKNKNSLFKSPKPRPR
jgi:transcriptional regulator with XRE-family HTH domain